MSRRARTGYGCGAVLPDRSDRSLLDCLRALEAGTTPQALWEGWVAPTVQTRPNQQIYEANDPADEIYLLLDGLVCVRTGEEEERHVALVLAAPALWGDLEVMAGEALRAASLDAVGVAKMLRFEPAALDEARKDPAFLRWHSRDLAERGHRMLLGGAAAHLSLERRVAQLVQVLPAVAGDAERLARLTGASVKAVQRALKKPGPADAEASKLVHRLRP